MRLLRLEVTHLGGLAEASLDVPPQGAVVVHAPNETGKSTLATALHLLLTLKDSARPRELLALRPAGLDVPSTVTAELLLADERVRVHKSWHRRRATELTTADGRSWTGDAAHEELRRRVDADVDKGLYEALRFAQGRSLEPAPAGASPMLLAHLRSAADDQDVDAGAAGDALLAAVDTHARSFWDARAAGEPRPKGDLKALADARTAAQRRVAEHETTLRALEAAGATHDVDAELARVVDELARVEAALVRARARARVDDARAALRGAEEARRARSAAVADLARDQARVVEARAAAEEAEREHGRLAEALGVARGAADRASADETAAAGTLAALRAAIAELVVRELDAIDAGLAAETIDDAVVDAMRALDARIRTTETVLADAAWRLTVAPAGPVTVRVDDGPAEVMTAPVERDVRARSELTLPDGTTVTLAAGGDTAARVAEVARWRTELAEALTAHGATSLEAAAARAEARRGAVTRREQLAQRRARVLGATEGRDAAGAPSADRTGDVPADPAGQDAAIERAVAGRAQATAERERTQAALARAEADLGAAASRRDDRAAHLAALSAELGARVARLETERQQAADTDLDAAVATAEAALAAVVGPAAPSAEGDGTATTSGADVAALEEQRAALDRERAALAERRGEARAGVRQRDGVAAALGAARSDLEEAERRWERLDREARAARRLAARLEAAKAAQADRHREPLRRRIAAGVGRLIGEGCDVQLDDDLQVIERRTGDGPWLAWHQLSGGAREQLAVVTGLAIAELCGPGGAPFWLDDAIVHTDPERLASLAEVLTATEAQVIVLTCRPELGALLPAADARFVPVGTSGA